MDNEVATMKNDRLQPRSEKGSFRNRLEPPIYYPINYAVTTVVPRIGLNPSAGLGRFVAVHGYGF